MNPYIKQNTQEFGTHNFGKIAAYRKSTDFVTTGDTMAEQELVIS